MSDIDIAGRAIGPGHPCFVIAEVGVNHNGDLEIARDLVRAAKECGADCVKFQTFRAEAIATRRAPKATYQLETTDTSESQFEMLKKLELTPSDHEEVIDLCRRFDLTFLSTPYGLADAVLLDRLGVAAFKVASGQIVELDFLEALASMGKPILLSTGMATFEEVARAVTAIRARGNSRMILLQCTTSYPAPPAGANLRAMRTMATAFDVHVGYSDHTPGIAVAIAAVALGALVIEKHLTLDRDMAGPDHRSSVTPTEFAALVRAIREVESALGDGVKRPNECERENIPGMRRSIVAESDIPAGTRIERHMLTYKRPGTGIPPSRLAEVVGRVAVADIVRDTLLSFEQLR